MRPVYVKLVGELLLKYDQMSDEAQNVFADTEYDNLRTKTL